MADISQELKVISVRNQVLLERLKQGQHDKFAPFLRRIEKAIRIRLGDEGDKITTKKALNALLADSKAIQTEIYAAYNEQFKDDLSEIALNQASLESASYTKTVEAYTAKEATEKAILTAIRVNPLQVTNYTGVPLLESFISDLTAKEIQRINTVITQGYSQGATISQMTSALRGTKANNYNDGQYAKVNNANRSMVRTATQHVSTQARQEAMKANSDLVVGYEWVSTLDSGTTPICAGLDGREFKLGEGPLPPAHIGCRSGTVPVLSEKYDFLKQGRMRAARGADGGTQVSTKETYYSFLKTQPKEFQETAIGVAKSKLLRDGGLSAEEFAKQSLNRNFEPLTLKEWQKKSPQIFENAGLL